MGTHVLARVYCDAVARQPEGFTNFHDLALPLPDRPDRPADLDRPALPLLHLHLRDLEKLPPGLWQMLQSAESGSGLWNPNPILSLPPPPPLSVKSRLCPTGLLALANPNPSAKRKSDHRNAHDDAPSSH